MTGSRIMGGGFGGCTINLVKAELYDAFIAKAAFAEKYGHHFVTYILCIGLGYAAYYNGWNCESLKSLTIGAVSWGIGLLIHFIFFIFEQKKTIKGYARDEIFQ